MILFDNGKVQTGRNHRQFLHPLPRIASVLHLLPLYASERRARREGPTGERQGLVGFGTATLCFPPLPVYRSRHTAAAV